MALYTSENTATLDNQQTVDEWVSGNFSVYDKHSVGAVLDMRDPRSFSPMTIDGKTRFVVNVSNTLSDLPSEIRKDRMWIKVAGKNGMRQDDAKTFLAGDNLDIMITYLTDTFGADFGVLFDGDNNEDNAPFSKLIERLIMKRHIVVAVKEYEPEDGIMTVSPGFYSEWDKVLKQSQDYRLFLVMPTSGIAKEEVTRDYVNGSIYIGSTMPAYTHKDLGIPRQGYTEVKNLENNANVHTMTLSGVDRRLQTEEWAKYVTIAQQHPEVPWME